MTTVTVITPAYNAEKYILDTIKSVAIQNVQDIEMIIVDDNSSDRTFEILQEASARYSFLKVMRNHKNMGPAFCRNLAIRKSQGQYLAFLDSDDVWLPNKLKSQLEFMRKGKFDFSYTSYYLMDEEGHSLNTIVTGKEGIDYQQLLYSCPIGCLTVMYEKKKFKKTYMPNIPRGQDYGLWLKLIQQGSRVGYLDQPLAKYRKSSKSISSAKRKKIVNMYHLYNNYLSINPFHSVVYVMSHIVHSYMKSHRLVYTKRVSQG